MRLRTGSAGSGWRRWCEPMDALDILWVLLQVTGIAALFLAVITAFVVGCSAIYIYVRGRLESEETWRREYGNRAAGPGRWK